MKAKLDWSQESVESALDLAIDALLAAGAPLDKVLAALWLKGCELERGKHVAPTRQ